MVERGFEIKWGSSTDNIDAIVGLGLLSDYKWSDEDIVEALRRKCSLPIDANIILA